MWKQIENTEFYLTFIQKEYIGICVTDYICVWTANYSRKSFTAQLKDSNEDLELDNENTFYENGIYLLSNLNKLKKISIKKEKSNEDLCIFMRASFGYPFCFEFKLVKGSPEIYFEKVTLPMLNSLNDLRASQSELRRLLLKKDKEIDEYKSEGGEIVLRHLKTVAYDDKEHMNKFTKYEENFNEIDIQTLINKKVNVLPEPSKVKQEPAALSRIMPESNPIKQEPIKEEVHTPVFEESTPQFITPSLSCKQEVIKTETQLASNRPTCNASPRKRLKKLNF